MVLKVEPRTGVHAMCSCGQGETCTGGAGKLLIGRMFGIGWIEDTTLAYEI